MNPIVDEVIADQPKSTSKDFDYVTLAALIIQIIGWLIQRWKSKHPQTEAKKVGLLKRLVLRSMLRKEYPNKQISDGLLKSILLRLSTKSDDQIKVLKDETDANI